MSDFLAHMAYVSLLRAEAVRARAGWSELQARVTSARPPQELTLSDTGFDLIAEVKLASPSEGRLLDSDPVEQARGLLWGGAAALSVLTESSEFGGGLHHLESVSSSVDLPVMRKDFLVDPIQVLEARAHGASGVLLIARILDRSLLVEMTELALGLGMFVLVEIFDESDLQTASAVFDRDVMVGVNARDLTTLGIDNHRHARLASLLPADVPKVAESGLTFPADVSDVVRLGYGLALVGSALSRSPHPSELVRSLVVAGREAAAKAAVS